MKKFICTVLCALIVFSCCFVPSFASEKKNDNPTILISGFLCSQLYFNYNTDDEINIWKAMLEKATELIGDEFSTAAGALAKFALGNDSEVGAVLGEYAEDIL